MSEPANAFQPRILIIDDEPQIRRLLSLALESHGYRVDVAESGKSGMLNAIQHPPQLVLLDLGLPDLNGLEVLARLREWTRVPVIVLTASDGESEKVTALDSGADDYVTKPFNTAELLARVRVALRHAEQKEETPVYRAGSLTIDLGNRQVLRSGVEVTLTITEYNLLKVLVRHAGKVLTHRQLLRDVWGPNAEAQVHYLRVYIARLREKLEESPAQPQWILTEPGIGYRWSVR
jgi:two-component system KDP operon response regulator KdpE